MLLRLFALAALLAASLAPPLLSQTVVLTHEPEGLGHGYTLNDTTLYNLTTSTTYHDDVAYCYDLAYSSKRKVFMQWDMSKFTNVRRIESARLQAYHHVYTTSNGAETVIMPFHQIPNQLFSPVDQSYTSSNASKLVNATIGMLTNGGWMASYKHSNTGTTTRVYELDGQAKAGSTRTGGVDASAWLQQGALDGFSVMMIYSVAPNYNGSLTYWYGPLHPTVTNRPVLKIDYVPKMEVKTNSAPDARVDFPYSLVPEAQYGVAPYLWSFDPIQNADWLSMPDPRTGELVGKPRSEHANTTCVVRLRVTDDNGAGESAEFTLNFIISDVRHAPFVDNFEGSQLGDYDVQLGSQAEAKLATGNAAATGAQGLVLNSTSTTAWVLDASSPADQAILDDPAQWGSGLASPDPSARHGVLSWFLKSPNSTSMQIDFDYKIEVQSTNANRDYFANFVLEWSEDQGATWHNAMGAGANANGIYRGSTTGFAHETIVLPLSGTQTFVTFRYRWLVQWPGTIPSVYTLVAIDNLEVRSPVEILTQSIDNPAETVPYERLDITHPVRVTGGNGDFSWSFGAASTPGAVMHAAGRVIEWPARGMALELYQDTTSGETRLRVPATIGATLYNGAPKVGAAGNYQVELVATDSSPGQYSDSQVIPFVVLPAPPALTLVNSAELPAAAEGREYGFALSAYGGVPPYSFELVTSTLSWISMPGDSGALSGTPPFGTNGQSGSIEVRVSDLSGASAQRTYTVSIVNALTVAQGSLPAVTETQTSITQLYAAGGTPPYTWAIIDGLPHGMKLEPLTGKVFGAPVAGTSAPTPRTLVVQVADANGQTTVRNVSMQVNPALTSLFTITSSNSLPVLTEGEDFDWWMHATGGEPPYSWTVAPGSLPVGLSMSEDGHISGAPMSGTHRQYAVTVTVRDANGVAASPRVFDLTILEHVQPLNILTPALLPSGDVGTYYVATVSATGGIAPYSWEVVAPTVLPAPFSLDPNVGLISGLATLGEEGNYSFKLRVTDSSPEPMVMERVFNITIDPLDPTDPLEFVTTALPNARIGDQYGTSVFARGGRKPYSFRIVGGNRPNGINFSLFGALAGRPEVGADGNFPLTFEIEDASGLKIQRTMDLKVLQATDTSDEVITPVGDAALDAGGGCAARGESGLPFGLVAFASLALLALRRRRVGDRA